MTLDPARPKSRILRPLNAKLVFNMAAGQPNESAEQLAQILTYLQSWQIWPEVFMVHPHCRLHTVVSNAIRRGISLIIASGGDGTVDSVMGAMVGTRATLGIIPTGTQNNIACSLGIPRDLAEAAALLRQGHRIKVDVGQLRYGGTKRWFLESATVGLLSALYPAADDIQHGNLARIGDLLATLASAPASEMVLSLDGGRQNIVTTAHVALVANMPYVGARFQVAPDVSFNDSQLDVLVYSELGKLDLVGYAVQQVIGSAALDPRIQHYRAKRIVIRTDPAMPIMADGVMLGNGSFSATVHPRSLAVMAGATPQPSIVLAASAQNEAMPNE